MWVFILATVLACGHSQHVKTANYGVKGGYHGPQGYQQNTGYNGMNNTQQYGHGGYNGSQNYNAQSQVGVCYIEVPTASLVRDPSHAPAGNGSRPDLSRIQSCCSGYVRNIHNHQLCDPVCSQECVNALCTAPETCTCFYDHVKNLAGFCVATCPVGCQNGHCAGGECICKDGYLLDSESKYCLPSCKDNCGGLGNCTAPNTCTCRSGYQSTPEGSCKPSCDKPCVNGDCVAPNDCRCKQGYSLDQQGQCVPHCAQSCGPTGRCISPNVCSNPTAGSPGNPHNVPTPSSSSAGSYNNQYYPSNHPQFNYSSSHPQSPDNLRPYYSPNSSSPQSNYPGYGNQYPNYPGSSSYYPNDYHYQQTYNISSESQVRPNYPNNNQSSYSPSSNYPHPSGQPIYSQNQTGYNPYQPYNPSGSNRPNNSYYPPPYQPYYPNQPTNSLNISNQHGYYPGQPGYPNSQQGYYPNQPGYNPSQPGYNPSQPGYNPSQPGYNPSQPGYNPNRPGNSPNQPGYNPSQSVYNPNQPGYQPNQPGNSQNPTHLNSSYPYQPGQSNQLNSTNPYQPLYPSHQLPIYGQSGNEHLIPQCSQPCINGICVEGNRCSCNSGYVLDNADPTGSRCLPHCPGGCPNGVCSAPNFCICNMGYRKEQGVKGRAGCVKRIRRSVQP